MDRYRAVFVALALMASNALAGEWAPAMVWTGAAPSGACKGSRVAIAVATGSIYCCQSGTWAACPDSLRATTTVDLPQILTNACTHTDVALSGAAVGMECSVGLPAGFPDQTFATCHVDAADNVDLHVCNLGSTPYDPSSATYSVRVFK